MSRVPAEPKRWWLLPLLVTIAVFAAAVGLVARDFYQRPGVEAGPTTQPSPTTTTSPGSTAKPAAQPGSGTVRLAADASEHPLGAAVQQVLQSFFQGINGRDYDRWRSSVTAERARASPRQQWLQDYRTTKDGSITVYRIESASPDTLRVLLSFVSVQDVSAAPIDFQQPCISWHVVFALTVEGGGWRIDTGPTAKSPQHAKC